MPHRFPAPLLTLAVLLLLALAPALALAGETTPPPTANLHMDATCAQPVAVPGSYSGQISASSQFWLEFTVPAAGLESLQAEFEMSAGRDPAMELYDAAQQEITASDFFGVDTRGNF